MYILEVIPLVMLPPQVPQLLSYFFDSDLPRGALVRVPIGTRLADAVVISSNPLEHQKGSVKKAGFQLKKIAGVVCDEPLVDQQQLKLALWISQHYFAPLGQTLKTVLPPFLAKPKLRLLPPSPAQASQRASGGSSPYKPLVIAVRAKETLGYVRSYIDQTISDGGQVLLVLPERTVSEYFVGHLDSYEPVHLYAGIPPKKLFGYFQSIASGSVGLVIGTRTALFAPFKDLRLIVIDDPGHEFYRSDMTPRYSTPDVARKLAELTGARLIFTVPVLSVNNAYGNEKGLLELHNELPDSRPDVSIVDMGSEVKTGNFSVLSRTLQMTIADNIRQKRRILLYSSRRAYSGLLICKNCTASIQCPNCSTPMRVHKAGENMLVCYHCAAYQSFPTQCPNCSSYKLQASGSPGSQKIAEAVRSIIAQDPDLSADVFILDSDLTRTLKQEQELTDALIRSSNPVLVATQMVLSFRHPWKFDTIGVVSADALESAPDFRTQERVIYQFEKLNDFDPAQIIIQTYNPDNPLFAQIRRGTYEPFFDQELAVRKTLFYPPFSRLVKLSFRHGDERKASLAARTLAEHLRMVTAQLGLGNLVRLFGPSPALVARERSQYVQNIVLKISHQISSLETILKFVPSGWTIDVDPRSVV